MKLYTLFASDPFINVTRLKKILLESFDIKNVEEILNEQQAEGAVQLPMGASGLQTGQPNAESPPNVSEVTPDTEQGNMAQIGNQQGL